MTVYFLDSSALLKRYITETGSTWINSLIKAGHMIVISQIAPIELMSGISRQKREGKFLPRTALAMRLLINRYATIYGFA